MRLRTACLALVATLAARIGGSPLSGGGGNPPSRTDHDRARLAPRSHVRHEWHDDHMVEGWRQKERADANASLPVRIGLMQSAETIQEGYDKLLDISMPHSENYGKHLTAEQVTRMFAPPEDRVEAVRNWLISAGIARARISQSVNKQWIQFDAKVGEVEGLLFAEYYLYEHLETGLKNVACPGYHVPADIRAHIDYITPGIKLASYGFDERAAKNAARKRRRRSNAAIQSDIAGSDIVQALDPGPKPIPFNSGGCDRFVTAKCIQELYNLPKQKDIAPAQIGNELGIFQSLNQHYSQDDLNSYFHTLAPWVPNGTHPELRSINGALGPARKGDSAMIGEEADLDFEVAIPLIYPQKTVLFQTDDEWYQKDMSRPGSSYTGFFNTLFDAIDGSYCTFDAYGQEGNCEDPQCRDPVYPSPHPGGYQGELMCGEYEPTNVIAISYSGVERVLPYNYMQRQCIEVLKLGLRGVTVVESSGDNGVGGSRFDRRAGCLGPDQAVFNPRTMSNCPYVLSVGATVMVNDTTRPPAKRGGGPQKYEEVATTFFPSGGGFSNVFGTPIWQETAVANYLASAELPFDGYADAGLNYSKVGLEPGLLFNKAGRGYPDVSAVGDNVVIWFRDTTDKIGGTSIAVPIWGAILTLINEKRLAAGKTTVGFINPVLYDFPEAFTDITVGRNPGCGTEGFHVGKGWDPVTGLGTPIYPKLLKVFMDLP